MHDRHGNPLAVGDKVIIEGTIKQCYDPSPEQEYCQIQVETEVPMAGNAFTVSLNAKQVTKVDGITPS